MPISFDVNKDNLAMNRMDVSNQNFPEETDKSVWLKTEKFAFSANNITYAAFGKSMSYWDLFPRDADWGNIPVWGNATVIKSNRPDISVGQKVYGIFPMAEEVMLNLDDFMPGFLMDLSDYRSSVSSVYNRYTLLQPDQAQMPEHVEDALVVFRPLFITAYLLSVYLEENDYFGADQIVLTSGSSKTAICLSHFLKNAKAAPKIKALTSAQNLPFVSGLTSYDEAVAYDNFPELQGGGKLVVIDFAGDPGLIGKLKESMKDNLVKVVGIGAADWKNSERSRNFPEEDADFFFAPTHINNRIQSWGPAQFQKQTTEAWMSLMPTLFNWLKIQRVSGAKDIQETYLKILSNEVKSSEGFVFSF